MSKDITRICDYLFDGDGGEYPLEILYWSEMYFASNKNAQTRMDASPSCSSDSRFLREECFDSWSVGLLSTPIAAAGPGAVCKGGLLAARYDDQSVRIQLPTFSLRVTAFILSRSHEFFHVDCCLFQKPLHQALPCEGNVLLVLRPP